MRMLKRLSQHEVYQQLHYSKETEKMIENLFKEMAENTPKLVKNTDI